MQLDYIENTQLNLSTVKMKGFECKVCMDLQLVMVYAVRTKYILYMPYITQWGNSTFGALSSENQSNLCNVYLIRL